MVPNTYCYFSPSLPLFQRMKAIGQLLKGVNCGVNDWLYATRREEAAKRLCIWEECKGEKTYSNRDCQTDGMCSGSFTVGGIRDANDVTLQTYLCMHPSGCQVPKYFLKALGSEEATNSRE